MKYFYLLFLFGLGTTITLPERMGIRIVDTIANNMKAVTRFTIDVISEAGKPFQKKLLK